MRSLMLQYIFNLFIHLSFASANFSITKGGRIRVGSCNFSETLYHPIDDPTTWSACEDATSFTWTYDFDNDIDMLSEVDRVRLSRSNGFCPHRRCQLLNISSSGPNDTCPSGLCYTKVENGRPSFGACCFKQGVYNHGSLIGYFYKSQPTPKPIYKHNRVILGGNSSLESYERFINANEVLPRLIATQCPLTGNPSGYANTVNDVKVMALERNISYWVQIAPYSEDGSLPPPYELSVPSKFCDIFPLKYFSDSTDSNAVGVRDFAYTHHKENFYYNMTYTLYGHMMAGGVALGKPPNDSMNAECSTSSEVVRRVTHVWFYRWDDFSVPDAVHFSVLDKISTEASSHMDRNHSIAISCFSGRGRSGTFAAVVAAKHRRARTYSEVVDLIIEMRRSRDGLVETPAQMKFILRLLDEYYFDEIKMGPFDVQVGILRAFLAFIVSIAVYVFYVGTCD